MKHLTPGLVQPSGLNVDHISHDAAVVERYKADPLVHDKISVSLFAAAMEAARYSLDHAGELRIPTLLIHGADDQITSPEGSREFASRSDKVVLRVWPGGYHELHNEKFNEEVFRFIVDWMIDMHI